MAWTLTYCASGWIDVDVVSEDIGTMVQKRPLLDYAWVFVHKEIWAQCKGKIFRQENTEDWNTRLQDTNLKQVSQRIQSFSHVSIDASAFRGEHTAVYGTKLEAFPR